MRRNRWVGCSFSVRNAASNAIKLSDDAGRGGAILESQHFEDCVIKGAGRMGIELQNHDPMKTGETRDRLIDFRWIGGAVRNTGLRDRSGMGISLSGHGSDHRIDTVFENNLGAALENAGNSNSRFSGRCRRQDRPCAPISFTNGRGMRDNRVEDFFCEGTANGRIRLRNQTRLTLARNRFDVDRPIKFVGVTGTRSTGEVYRTGTPNPLWVDSR